jgi:hypothetical protein
MLVSTSFALASLAASIAAHLTLVRRMRRRPRASRRGAWLELAASVRWVASVPPAFALLIPAFELAGAWPVPARWSVSFVLAAVLVVLVANTLAAIWTLSPLAGARLGVELGAGDQRGTITGYGWCSLELTTPHGWNLHLPYLSIAFRPWALRRPEQPRLIDLRFHREHWDAEDLRALRQASVLLPYRDLGTPVRLSRRAHTAHVRFAIIGDHAADAVQRQLEKVIAAERDAPPLSIPPRA